MRIPIPERLQPKHVVLFLVSVFVLQQIADTDIVFSALFAVFVVLFAIGFNVAGGLMYASGGWIFFNALSTAIVGVTFKTFLFEPGNSHLLQPRKTMLIYCAGMAGFALAAFLCRRLRPPRGLLADMAAGSAMKRAAIGCFILGTVIQFATLSDFSTTGSFGSALRQINQFNRMAIILATTYEINASGGRRSTNWIVWAAGIFLFLYGLIYFSKEGMFVSVLTWLIPAIALGYNFSRKQLLLGGFTVFIMFYYLVPFSQYGRQSRDENGNAYANAVAAIGYLKNPNQVRRDYLAGVDVAPEDQFGRFYDQPQGLFDREQMLTPDDALIDFTDQGNVFGLLPTWQGFANIVPRFIWKNKPTLAVGNEYAHQLGVVGEDDRTTGISFSPTGDIYHQAEWLGVLVVMPVIMFMYFFILDGLTGSVRASPWPLLPIAMEANIAPQGLLDGNIYIMLYGSFSIIIIALMAKYVLPVFSAVITGTDRTRVRRTLDFGAARSATPVSRSVPRA